LTPRKGELSAVYAFPESGPVIRHHRHCFDPARYALPTESCERLASFCVRADDVVLWRLLALACHGAAIGCRDDHARLLAAA
jgi:hypothetical protein